MPKNPARTFALVNLAVFVVAVAVFLWLRDRGMLPESDDDPVQALFDDTTRASVDTLSLEDVQAASTAQIQFIGELLTDTSDTVRGAFTVRSPLHNHAYYLGAEVERADTSRTPMALWLVVGPRDQPRSVQSINETAAQYSVARRTSSAGEAERVAQAAAQLLARRLDATSTPEL